MSPAVLCYADTDWLFSKGQRSSHPPSWKHNHSNMSPTFKIHKFYHSALTYSNARDWWVSLDTWTCWRNRTLFFPHSYEIYITDIWLVVICGSKVTWSNMAAYVGSSWSVWWQAFLGQRSVAEGHNFNGGVRSAFLNSKVEEALFTRESV